MMTPSRINQKIEYLQKLENLLMLIQRDKTIDVPSLAAKLGTSLEDISRRIKYLGEFDPQRLLKVLPNNSLDDAKQVIKVFKHYSQISSPSNAEEELNYGKAIAILLYAIRIEMPAERINLLIAQSQYENKLIRLKQEKIEQKKLLKETKLEAREKKLEVKRKLHVRIINLHKATKARKIFTEFKTKNKVLIDKFLDISKRKASVLNEYGYEDEDALYKEIAEVMKIVLLQSGKYNMSDVKKYIFAYDQSSNSNDFPYPYNIIAKKLEKLFKTSKQGHFSIDLSDVNKLSGIEFECYLMGIFKNNGITDVRGTPTTGDQGADIIVHKDGKILAVQAKHHVGTIGNSAVQEIVGSLKYYGADSGWVITTSTFTKSAIALAQKNNITLIDRTKLSELPNLIKLL